MYVKLTCGLVLRRGWIEDKYEILKLFILVTSEFFFYNKHISFITNQQVFFFKWMNKMVSDLSTFVQKSKALEADQSACKSQHRMEILERPGLLSMIQFLCEQHVDNTKTKE